MFSKTCEYAIRAMIFIAIRSAAGKKTGIKEIAKETDAPEYFIAKILQELIKKELLLSVKGPAGGFFLNADLLQCSLADIVSAIDGHKIFTGCGLGLPNCSEERPCPIHHEFRKVRKDIYEMLQAAKLGELQEQQQNNLAFLKHQ